MGTREGPYREWAGEHLSLTTKGQYIQNRREGMWEEWHSNGVHHVRGTFKSDKREGKATRWRRDGSLAEEGTFVADAEHGLFRWYHGDGSLWKQGAYLHGKKEGVWQEWDRDGRIVSEEMWANDEPRPKAAESPASVRTEYDQNPDR